MAKIVFGAGASHGPQINIPAEKWHILRRKDELDSRLDYPSLLAKADPAMESEITPEKMKQRYDACLRAIDELKKRLEQAAPDVIVMIGDDQHEMFLNDNSPMFSIFRGAQLTGIVRPAARVPDWKKEEEDLSHIDSQVFPAYPALADHLISSLIGSGFDMAVADRVGKEPSGIGHAYMFLYQRLLTEGNWIPMVPLFINTFYPPNQAPLRRCCELGDAVRQAVESWGKDERVAVVFSGGLSHVVLDEALDRAVIDGIKIKSREALCALPEAELINGSSEIRSWVAAACALEHLDMTLVDYIPAYRSPAGTGCGMGFVYWS